MLEVFVFAFQGRGPGLFSFSSTDALKQDLLSPV